MPIHYGRTALYRLFGAEGELLYVGITTTPEVRLKQHAFDKPWWGDVAESKVEWFPTRVDAERAEREAIRKDAPKWNADRGGESWVGYGPAQSWLASPELRKAIAGYKRAVNRAAKMRDELEEAAIKEMLHGGASRHRMTRVLPFSPTHVKLIADRAGVPPSAWKLAAEKRAARPASD